MAIGRREILKLRLQVWVPELVTELVAGIILVQKSINILICDYEL
jgi:biotin carboxylase